MIKEIEYIVIDLFCGAGGTTTGFEQAKSDDPFIKVAKVVACINHDHLAIKSHWENHPEVEHFNEDITKMYGLLWKGILFKSSEFQRLIRLIELYRAFYPKAKIILWASLECTNFSKAKGGLPRDADSRTLADHLHPYITAINPDYIKIENVVEFMSWGPLDENGKPINRKNGQDFIRWKQTVCSHGYYDDWKQMNSADFGALTSRNRLFGCFARPGAPIIWPEPTHSKKPEKTSIVKQLKKWEPVKKALDFDDEGQSIFNRWKRIPKVKKTKEGYLVSSLNKYDVKYQTFGPIPDPLSPKTMQRLFMGSVKHIAGGKENYQSRVEDGKAFFIDQRNGGDPKCKSTSIDEPARTLTKTGGNQQLIKACFIQKYNSNRDKTGGNNGHSIEQPAPVIACQPRLSLAQFSFISRYNGVNGGNHDNSRSINEPIGALGCGDNQSKICVHFIDQQFSQGKQNQSVEEPLGALTCVPKSKLIQANFIDKQFSGSENHQSIESPSGAILNNDKHSLITAKPWLMNTNYNNVGSSLEDPSPVIAANRHHHYIVNPSWGVRATGSIESPCPVVIARQDKAPLYLITCEEGPVLVPVYEGDCEWTIKLKEFMALYGIADIKMRMLKVIELLMIQGFPSNYILLGNQTDQKKFIGNAVHPYVPEHWILAMRKYKMAA